MKFSEIITSEDQYEVSKAKAEIAFNTLYRLDQFYGLMMVYFPSHSVKV